MTRQRPTTIAFATRGVSRSAINLCRLLAVLAIVSGLVSAAAGAGRAAGGGNGDLPYGEYTCVDGYVWREAFPGDVVCVEPWVRDQAARDNAAAPYRVDPYGAYGPDTCVDGYVWREADPYDVVCVEPWVRDQTAADNAAAASRWVATAGTATAEDGGLEVFDGPAVAGGGLPSLWVSQAVGSPAPAANGAQRLAFSGQGFTVGGTVFIGLYRPGNEEGEPEYKYEVTPASHDGFAGGSFGLTTGLYDCQGDRPVAGVRYVAYAYDWATDAWSAGVDTWACEGMIATTGGGTGAESSGGGQQEQGADGPRIRLGEWEGPNQCADDGDPETQCLASYTPHLVVEGEGFSRYGVMTVGVYVPGTDTVVAQFDAVPLYGDSIDVLTDLRLCSSGETYEVQAYDWTTERWSNTLTVELC